MKSCAPDDPVWVDKILDWRWTWVIARCALVGIFLVSAILKAADLPAAVQEQEALGLYPGLLWACLTIGVQFIGSVLVISGRLVWLGAGMLGVFTMTAATLAHGFWTMQGQARFEAMNVFLEHIGLTAGLVLVALVAEHARRRDN